MKRDTLEDLVEVIVEILVIILRINQNICHSTWDQSNTCPNTLDQSKGSFLQVKNNVVGDLRNQMMKQQVTTIMKHLGVEV